MNNKTSAEDKFLANLFTYLTLVANPDQLTTSFPDHLINFEVRIKAIGEPDLWRLHVHREQNGKIFEGYLGPWRKHFYEAILMMQKHNLYTEYASMEEACTQMILDDIMEGCELE